MRCRLVVSLEWGCYSSSGPACKLRNSRAVVRSDDRTDAIYSVGQQARFVVAASVLVAQTRAPAKVPSKADPNFIATAADLKQRIAAQLRITKPDYVVFVPEVVGDKVERHGQRALPRVRRARTARSWRSGRRVPPRRSPDQHIAFAAVRDEGVTWSKPRIIAGPKKAGEGHMASWGYPLVSKSGRIYVLYSQHIGKFDSFFHHTGWLHGIYSDDNGADLVAAAECPRRAEHQRQPRCRHAAQHALLAETAATGQGRQVFRRLHALDELRGAENRRPRTGSPPTRASSSCVSRTWTTIPSRRT